MNIRVLFLGQPKIYIEEKEIIIKQNKPRAVFLYILYKGYCTRDELKNIFWGNLSEEKGKANLRNVLSRLKSEINYDLLLTDNNIVKINEKYTLEKDIDRILDQNNTSFLDVDNYIFMDKHGVESSLEFEQWVEDIRVAYEQIILKNMHYQLKNQLNENEDLFAEKIAEKIIDIDPYNEEAYRTLMKIYANRYDYILAIKLYKKLKELLNNDLGIEVEEESKRTYENIKLARESKKDTDGYSDLIRSNYISQVEYEYTQFIKGLPFKHCLISGEMGVGKTEIINGFLKKISRNIKIDTIQMRFEYQNNHSYLLNRLSDILSKSDEKIESKYKDLNSILEILDFCNEKRIIYIKDMQYIEVDTMEMLREYISINKYKNIFFIFEFSNTLCKNPYTLKSLRTDTYLKEIEVTNLNYSQYIKYVEDLVFKLKYDINESDILNKIYEKTLGNIMYINEAFYNIQNNGELKISRKNQRKNEMFMTLNQEELYILQLISVSSDGIPFSVIENNIELSTMDLSYTLERLEFRGFINTNISKDKTSIKIKYEPMKLDIYNSINISAKERFHNMILKYLEEAEYFGLNNYLEYYNWLIYHSKNSNIKDKEIRYEIDRLEYILGYYDEFYPDLDKYNNVEEIERLNKKQIYEKFDNLEAKLKNIFIKDKNYKNRLYFKLIFLKGRSLIRDGYENSGQDYINIILNNSNLVDDKDLIISAYLEKAYYGLRLGDGNIMKKNVDMIRKYDRIFDDLSLTGKLNRLEGLSHYLNKNYEKAIECYRESIEIYNKSLNKSNSIYGIAACYNYKGNSYRQIKEYEKAEKNHKIAISFCERNKVYKPLDEFYKDYAYTVYLRGDLKKTKELCLISLNYYELHASHWERSIVDNLLSLIFLDRGDIIEAKKYHRSAEIYVSKSPTRQELFLHDMAKEKLED